MGFISKYLLRGAGFVVAAQIFMTLRMTGDDFVEKLLEAVKLAMFAICLRFLPICFAGVSHKVRPTASVQ